MSCSGATPPESLFDVDLNRPQVPSQSAILDGMNLKRWVLGPLANTRTSRQHLKDVEMRHPEAGSPPLPLRDRYATARVRRRTKCCAFEVNATCSSARRISPCLEPDDGGHLASAACQSTLGTIKKSPSCSARLTPRVALGSAQGALVSPVSRARSSPELMI